MASKLPNGSLPLTTSQKLLALEFVRLKMTDIEGLNFLTFHGAISDIAVCLGDVADCDARNAALMMSNMERNNSHG